MKLKTLVINNIASIEDATIDFSGDLLGPQDLFLICGPTGSGKTTILDAICLALFNKTPRMESTSNSEVMNAFAENEAGNRLRDTLHLVRKNAVNASVILTFEADGREYTAHWRVTRSGQFSKGKETTTFTNLPLAEKVGRKLKFEWTLEDDKGEVFQKRVPEKIRDVIKMTFDQFCKTTMLAQGDFTKFLSSSADEKALILEKLVGTRQYSDVGRVINRTANDKKNELAYLDKELENFPVLSEEERTAKTAEIAELDKEVSEQEKQKTEVDEKLKWLDDRLKAEETEKETKGKLAEAERMLGTEEVTRDRATLDLWDKTTEVRKAMATRVKCETGATENAATEKRLANLYDVVADGLRYSQKRRGELSDISGRLAESVEASRKFEDMFAKADVIGSKHSAVLANEKYVSDNQPKIAIHDKTLAKLGEEAEELKKRKSEASAEIEKLEKTNETKKEKLKELKADEIHDEQKRLNDRKTNLLQIENSLKSLNKAGESLKQKQKAVEMANGEHQTAIASEKTAADEAEKSAKAANESRTIYEKAYLALDNHSRALRARLKAGDVCPVCGSIVESMLDETELKETLAPLEAKCKADENTATEAAAKAAQAKAVVTAALKAAENAAADVKSAADELDSCRAELRKKCENGGLDPDSVSAETIAGLLAECESHANVIADRQKQVDEIRREISANNDSIATIRRDKISVIDREMEKNGRAVEKEKDAKNNLAGGIAKATSAIKTDNEEIDTMLNPEWEPENPENFFDELKKAAEAYAELKQKQVVTSGEIEKLDREIGLARECKADIDAKFPEWNLRDAVEIREVTDMAGKWAKMRTDANLLAKSIETTARELSEANDSIAAFFRENPDITDEDVKKLLALTDSDIVGMRDNLSMHFEARAKVGALYEQALKRLEEFATSPLKEEETTESLLGLKEDLAGKVNARIELKGKLLKELENDEENRRRKGCKIAERDKLRVEYSEWEKLNRYLGSTEGKYFRNVAQSFILADLLDRANRYLASISNRYRLFCHPGTLTIMMRDSYQGGIERATNTLSGGESFIISLSLALGLSSMQNVDFEVDTLFIDEGFGTLSPEFLDPVITALKRLHETCGRRVGIISHVDTLRQRVGASIEVSRNGTTGSSSVTIHHN